MVTSIENKLPGTSKVWVYQSARKLTTGESGTIRNKVKDFVSNWTSHKIGVVADGDILFDLFIVLMADEAKVGVSGCSIDSSVHFVKALEHEYRKNFFDRWNIAYEKGSQIFCCNKNEFEELVSTGEIKDETFVFNNLVNNKYDFETRWKIPYSQSWLKSLRSSNTSFNSIL